MRDVISISQREYLCPRMAFVEIQEDKDSFKMVGCHGFCHNCGDVCRPGLMGSLPSVSRSIINLHRVVFVA